MTTGGILYIQLHANRSITDHYFSLFVTEWQDPGRVNRQMGSEEGTVFLGTQNANEFNHPNSVLWLRCNRDLSPFA